jgi:hypothetical protein
MSKKPCKPIIASIEYPEAMYELVLGPNPRTATVRVTRPGRLVVCWPPLVAPFPISGGMFSAVEKQVKVLFRDPRNNRVGSVVFGETGKCVKGEALAWDMRSVRPRAPEIAPVAASPPEAEDAVPRQPAIEPIPGSKRFYLYPILSPTLGKLITASRSSLKTLESRTTPDGVTYYTIRADELSQLLNAPVNAT